MYREHGDTPIIEKRLDDSVVAMGISSVTTTQSGKKRPHIPEEFVCLCQVGDVLPIRGLGSQGAFLFPHGCSFEFELAALRTNESMMTSARVFTKVCVPVYKEKLIGNE